MATDRRGASWLRRERLTTSAVDVDPETYKKLLPEKKSKLGKWYQKRSWRSHSGAMKHTMKNNWIQRNITGPVSDVAEKHAPFLYATGHDLARDYGMSEASGRYGTALQAKGQRSRKIRRADKGIARKY